MTAGNNTHIQTNLHDITEHKRAELALREWASATSYTSG